MILLIKIAKEPLEIEHPKVNFDHFPGLYLIISGKRLDFLPELENFRRKTKNHRFAESGK
jgi:hypothetical protein